MAKTLDLKSVFNKYLASQKEGGTPLTEEESAVLMNPATINQFYKLASDSGIAPDQLADFAAGARYNDKSLTEAQRNKRDRTAIDSYNVGQALNTGRNLLQGIQQTVAGDRTLRTLEGHPPQYAPLAPENAALRNRMGQAQIQAETGLAPGIRAELNRQNADNYQKSLDNAKAVGGGQSGVYASLAQQASLDRMRGNLQVGGLDNQARQQAQENYGRLIPQQMAEQQFKQQIQDARVNNLARPMYFGKLNAANQLAQTGRSNVNDALATLPMMAGRLAREYYPGQRGLPQPPAVSQLANTPPTTNEGLLNQPPLPPFDPSMVNGFSPMPYSGRTNAPVNTDPIGASGMLQRNPSSFADLPMEEFINRYQRKRPVGNFKPPSY